MEMKKSSLWQQIKARVTQKDMNESLTTASAMKRHITPGDAVIHTVSGARGIVYAIEKIGGLEVISFNDVGGIAVRRVARQECRLVSAGDLR